MNFRIFLCFGLRLFFSLSFLCLCRFCFSVCLYCCLGSVLQYINASFFFFKKKKVSQPKQLKRPINPLTKKKEVPIIPIDETSH